MAAVLVVVMIQGNSRKKRSSRNKPEKTEREADTRRQRRQTVKPGASAPVFTGKAGIYRLARLLIRYSATATMTAPVTMDKTGISRP